MRRGDDLDSADRSMRICLHVEVVEQDCLQLGMETRLGLFDKKKRQLGFPSALQLHDDGRDIEQVGVAKASPQYRLLKS